MPLLLMMTTAMKNWTMPCGMAPIYHQTTQLPIVQTIEDDSVEIWRRAFEIQVMRKIYLSLTVLDDMKLLPLLLTLPSHLYSSFCDRCITVEFEPPNFTAK
jgi:hypothetical protein